MKELSKIWDTVNVKFLSTVRPFLRAPLRKKFKILRGESFTEISSKFGANKDTNTNTEQTTQNPIPKTHIHTHKYQQTNKHETQVFKQKMRNVARFKSPVLDAI